MRRPIDFVVALKEQPQRIHIVMHVAVGRAHDARGPAHHMIAGKERLLFFQGKADVVRCVTRRMHALNCPAIAFNNVAVAHFNIRHKIHIAVFFADAAAMRSVTIGRRAGQFLERRSSRRMIAMRMRDENMRDGLAFERAHQCFNMRVDHRAGIDHRDLTVADDVQAVIVFRIRNRVR